MVVDDCGFLMCAALQAAATEQQACAEAMGRVEAAEAALASDTPPELIPVYVTSIVRLIVAELMTEYMVDTGRYPCRPGSRPRPTDSGPGSPPAAIWTSSRRSSR